MTAHINEWPDDCRTNSLIQPINRDTAKSNIYPEEQKQATGDLQSQRKAVLNIT